MTEITPQPEHKSEACSTSASAQATEQAPTQEPTQAPAQTSAQATEAPTKDATQAPAKTSAQVANTTSTSAETSAPAQAQASASQATGKPASTQASAPTPQSIREQLVATPKKRLIHGAVSTVIVTLVILFASQLIAGLASVLLKPVLTAVLSPLFDESGRQTFTMYFVFFFMWLTTLLILFLVKPWRRYIKALWTKPSGNTLKMVFLGLGVGLLMNGVCILIATLAGNIPTFTLVAIQPIQIILLLVAVFIQSSYEEMLMRGFAYQRIQRVYGPAAAIIITSVLFAFIHIFNTGITPMAFVSIICSGIVFALAVYYLNSIWMAFGMHAGWNFCQGILFGLPNSGNAAGYAIFKPLGEITSGVAWDPVFGVEGTIISIIVLLITSGIIIWWGRKHPRPHFDVDAD